MSVVVVGLNHRHAPLDVLERLAVSAEQAPKALLSLIQRPHVAEAVVVSTCNRVEVYARVHRFHGGIADIRDFLCEWGGFAPEDLFDRTYEYHDDRAAAHLFSVTCGLDSAVVGEPQVARQVKQAYLHAESEGACGALLGTLFQRALKVARRVRTTTGLDRTSSSMLEAGLDAVRAEFDDLAERSVLVVGAGKVGTMAARWLRDEVGRLVVVNRTFERAQRLAAEGGSAVAMDRLAEALAAADLVITSTAAHRPLIDRAMLGPIMDRRPDRPIVLLDLAVPRDVAVDCAELDGVRVLDVDTVATTVDATPAQAELTQAARLVADEVEAFAAWQQSRRLEPTIAALRRHAETIRTAELERLASKLAELDDRQRGAVEQVTRGIINTLLHEPTVRLKAASARDHGRWQAEVLRDLFDLDDPDADA